jgi:S-disulfanyl-L-cysteine oxidoreductase SoxD
MRHLVRAVLFGFVVLTFVACGSLARLLAQPAHQHPQPGTHPSGGAHRHPQAAKMTNPVQADANSIAAGKTLYDKHCAGCHGETGKGDGSMGADLDPKPPDLTDSEWKHGSTDGELFLVIRDGAKGTGMKPFAKKLTPHQIWDVINYVHSIGPAKSH